MAETGNRNTIIKYGNIHRQAEYVCRKHNWVCWFFLQLQDELSMKLNLQRDYKSEILTALFMVASPLAGQKKKSGNFFSLVFSGICTINEQSRAGWVLEAFHQQCSEMRFGIAGHFKSGGPGNINIMNWFCTSWLKSTTDFREDVSKFFSYFTTWTFKKKKTKPELHQFLFAGETFLCSIPMKIQPNCIIQTQTARIRGLGKR